MTEWTPISEKELAEDMKSHGDVAIVEHSGTNLVRGSFDHYNATLDALIVALNNIEQYSDVIVNDKGQIIDCANDIVIAIRMDDGAWSAVFKNGE